MEERGGGGVSVMSSVGNISAQEIHWAPTANGFAEESC